MITSQGINEFLNYGRSKFLMAAIEEWKDQRKEHDNKKKKDSLFHTTLAPSSAFVLRKVSLSNQV